GGEGGKAVQHEGAGYSERVPIPASGEFPVTGPEPGIGEIDVDCFGGGVDPGFDRDGGDVGGGIVRNQRPVLNARDELPVLSYRSERNGGRLADRKMNYRLQRQWRRGRIGKTESPEE